MKYPFSILLSAALLAGPGLSAETHYDAVLTADGSGTHASIQSAIAAPPDNGFKPFVIFIKRGTYRGQIIVPKEKKRLRFVGEETEKTIVTYALNRNEPAGGVPIKFKGNGVNFPNLQSHQPLPADRYLAWGKGLVCP